MTALDEKSATGKFLRTAAECREWVSPSHATYKPASGRYHLVISYACPWANRCLVVRAMKGLEDVIGLSVVHPTWQPTKPEVDSHSGWTFGDSFSSSSGMGQFDVAGCVPLPAEVAPGAKSVRDIYDAGAPGTTKFTVPLLWDKETGTIVNNESSDIVVMLNSAFNDFAKNPDLDLNTLSEEQKAVDEWTYPGINDGVYRCGFAKSQAAYDEAVISLFSSLDRLESLLTTSRYACGKTLTLSDIRLFMTLVRFDEVYIVYFKCNKKAISEYPAIRNYCREMYQLPKMAECIKMEHIKVHYFTSHPTLNHYAIIPAGPNVIEDFEKPHDRASL